MIIGSVAKAATARPLKIGDQDFDRSAKSSGCARTPSVLVNLGHSETTATLYFRNSSAAPTVNMSTPALTTLYDTFPVYFVAPIEETLTMRPLL